MITLSLGLLGICAGGYQANHLDIAPLYAGQSFVTFLNSISSQDSFYSQVELVTFIIFTLICLFIIFQCFFCKQHFIDWFSKESQQSQWKNIESKILLPH